MQIRLQYLYEINEDEALQGQVVFANPEGKSAGWVRSEMEKLLIGKAFFIPNRIGIPPLDGSALDAAEDSDYHEPEDIEETEEEPTLAFTAAEFIAHLAKYKKENPEEFW
jgi:hypothetical protein